MPPRTSTKGDSSQTNALIKQGYITELQPKLCIAPPAVNRPRNTSLIFSNTEHCTVHQSESCTGQSARSLKSCHVKFRSDPWTLEPYEGLQALDRHAQIPHSRYRIVSRAFKPQGLLKNIVTRRAQPASQIPAARRLQYLLTSSAHLLPDAKPDYVKGFGSHPKSGT